MAADGGENALQALGEFEKIFIPARNLASRTRREYRNDLEDLVAFLDYAGVERVGEIGLAHLDRYLVILDERVLS